jgi:hypothetical protein
MASPADYPAYLYNALYKNETGEVIGLDEVQLLDPIPVERIPKLIACLGDADLYLAYQCGLVLAAWGVREGVLYLQRLVATRVDKTADFEPHRLWGQDNVYDMIAEALGIAILSGYAKRELVELIKSILKLYGECYFERRLKQVLLDLEEPELLPLIKQAMSLALDHKRYYQASQLLPVLGRYDSRYAMSQLALFEGLITQDGRIRYNLDEMRNYLTSA